MGPVRRVPALALLALGGAAPLEAHDGPLVAPHDVWTSWSLEPLVVVALLVTGWAYARGVRTVWRRAGRGRGVTVVHAGAFAGALCALVLALVSPIDRLGGTLFSAHMVQHLLLVVVAAPLLALAAPDRVFTWALPRGGRRRVARWLNAGPARAASTLATRPVNAWLLHAAVLWIWHIPGPYGAALRSDYVHAVEHATFFVTSLLFWWVVLRPPRRRAAYGLGVLFVFAAAMQSGVLGALITFAGSAWYPEHAAGAALWGMTGLEDQQIAGLIMWVPAGLIYVLVAGLLCAAWLELPTRRLVAGGVAGVVLLLAGCDGAGRRATVDAVIAGGDPQAGREALRRQGCAACHQVPGVAGPSGAVGPSLAAFGARAYIAGGLPNTPDAVVRWIQDPQESRPGTAMPDLGISEATARDIAAYLYQLR